MPLAYSLITISNTELDAIKRELNATLDTFRGRSTAGSEIDTLQLSRGAGIRDLALASNYGAYTQGYDPASVDFEFSYPGLGDVHLRISTINGSVWFVTPVTEEVIDHVFGVIRRVKGLP